MAAHERQKQHPARRARGGGYSLEVYTLLAFSIVAVSIVVATLVGDWLGLL